MTDVNKTNAQLMVELALKDGSTENLARLCLDYGLNTRQLFDVFEVLQDVAYEDGYEAGKFECESYWNP